METGCRHVPRLRHHVQPQQLQPRGSGGLTSLLTVRGERASPSSLFLTWLVFYVRTYFKASSETKFRPREKELNFPNRQLVEKKRKHCSKQHADFHGSDGALSRLPGCCSETRGGVHSAFYCGRGQPASAGSARRSSTAGP